MDHDQATQIQASARYVLGDLTPSEVEAFEEHFFSCPICAEEMRTEAIFAENLRAVFREQDHPGAVSALVRPAPVPVRTGPSRLERWRLAFAVPILAAACLLVLAGYQNLITIPRLRTQVTALTTGPAPFSFPLKLARGISGVTIPRDALVFAPYFDLPKHKLSARYVCVIESSSGARVLERTIAAAPPGQPLQLLLRHSDFPSGTYLVKVRGEGSPDLIATYTLDVKDN